MIRGVEKRTIFADDSDREDFVTRLDHLVQDLGFACTAWALIPNHAHLVLRTGPFPLATLMSRLNTHHAQRFNRRNDRVGHLFQGRYKAELIEDEGGLARATAYVLGNPVRHRLIPMDALPEFRWTAYSGLVGARSAWGFEAPGRLATVLGDGDFDEVIRSSALRPDASHAALEPDMIEELNGLIAESCARHGIDVGALRSRGRSISAVRGEICRRAVRGLGASVTEVARAMGVSRRSLHRNVAQCTDVSGSPGSDPGEPFTRRG